VSEEEVIECEATYPGARPYALQSLIGELASVGLHCRDGSWRICTCIPEKHLPLIAALSSEAYGFAKLPEEKKHMEKIMMGARERHHRVLLEGMSFEVAEDIRAWARAARHVITSECWLEDALEAWKSEQ
jgi:hypothetical protein